MTARYQSTSRYRVSNNLKEADKKATNSVSYTVHTASEGDTLDLIAHSLFGDFTRYWEIADINPHVKFPNKLKAGQVIRIPR